MKNQIILTLIICCQPTFTAEEPIKPYEQAIYEWTRTFAQVAQLVGEKHYSAENIDKCMTSAISGFLDCLDPHSGFLDPETYKMILEATTGEFFGIGVVIDNTRRTKDRHLTIVETIPQGPAEKAGAKAGDKIVEIEGTTLDGMATEKVTALLKGPRNSTVSIKVIREGFPDLLTFDIKRDVIREQNTLSFSLPEENIAYLSLSQFSENVVKSLESLLQRAAKDKCRGIIIDLRNNSGGLLDVAIEILGLFVPKKSIVVTTKNRQNTITESYKTQRDPVTKKLTTPIIILVNNFTASAAEILAGCLKFYSEKAGLEEPKKGQKNLTLPVFLLGTKTFGKGSVQEVIPVSNNSAIKLTTSLYYLPNDITIQGTGIQPDFTVERLFPASEQMSWISKVYGSEGALSNAIKPTDKKKGDKASKKKDEKKNSDKNWVEKTREVLEKDNQFRSAINMINLYHFAQKNSPQEVSSRNKAVTFLKSQCPNETIILEEVKS